ncbi:hypothetical protein RUND412_003862 [Rhizina undulata]
MSRKKRGDILMTWSRPSSGYLKDLTGSKIGFGERMLDFLESLYPDSPDAPEDPSHVFYPPTLRCGPAKTPLPFDLEALGPCASTLRRETDKIPRNYPLIPLYPEPISHDSGQKSPHV